MLKFVCFVITSNVLTYASVGGTPTRLAFSEMFSVLKLFKFPISGGRERRSFPEGIKNNKIITLTVGPIVSVIQLLHLIPQAPQAC